MFTESTLSLPSSLSNLTAARNTAAEEATFAILFATTNCCLDKYSSLASAEYNLGTFDSSRTSVALTVNSDHAANIDAKESSTTGTEGPVICTQK